MSDAMRAEGNASGVLSTSLANVAPGDEGVKIKSVETYAKIPWQASRKLIVPITRESIQFSGEHWFSPLAVINGRD